MAIRIGQPRDLYCGHCGALVKTRSPEGDVRFGRPFVRCRTCGRLVYDEDVLEPALLSPGDFRRAQTRRQGSGFFIFLVLLEILVFFAMLIFLKSLVAAILIAVAVLAVAIGLWVYTLNSPKGQNRALITESLERLQRDPAYAQAVISYQGMAAGCPYDRPPVSPDGPAPEAEELEADYEEPEDPDAQAAYEEDLDDAYDAAPEEAQPPAEEETQPDDQYVDMK